MIPNVKNVLYATDLSKNSAYAFGYAVSMARNFNAKIHIIHVIEPVSSLLTSFIDKQSLDELSQDLKGDPKSRIEERVKEFAIKEIKDDPEILKRIAGIRVLEGDPATEILNKADELSCDTIIMGTHGKGAISRTFLGSVSEKVLHRTRKPAYIIPLPA